MKKEPATAAPPVVKVNRWRILPLEMSEWQEQVKDDENGEQREGGEQRDPLGWATY